jgi:hypothetical protein
MQYWSELPSLVDVEAVDDEGERLKRLIRNPLRRAGGEDWDQISFSSARNYSRNQIRGDDELPPSSWSCTGTLNIGEKEMQVWLIQRSLACLSLPLKLDGNGTQPQSGRSISSAFFS